MPALAVYIGALNISVLVEKDDGVYDFSVFPYVYSKELFSNYCTESEFYKNLLEAFLKTYKKKLTSYDVLFAGYMNTPELDFPVKFTTNLNNILSSVTDYFPILMNNFTVITKSGFSCSMKYKSADLFNYKNQPNEVDYYANLGIYPQLVPTDVATQIDLDDISISNSEPSCYEFSEGIPVIFGGSRFAQSGAHDILKYSLILNSFKNPGVYKVFMDPKNTFVLLEMLKMFKNSDSINSSEYLTDIGSIISTRGATECLVTQDAGVGQFFSLDADNIFVLPLNHDSKATLEIKNKEFGTRQYVVTGGKLGLIFDTRVKKSNVSSEIKIFNNLLRQINEVLAGEFI